MVRIDWRMGPAYPLGIQDSALGVVGDTVISAGGFSRHVKDILEIYPDAFAGKPSGFTNLSFTFDLAADNAAWQPMPDIPASPPRQGAHTAVVGDAMYVIGGFNYTAPFCYRDVFRVRQRSGGWTWESLPSCPVPWPVCEAGAVALGRRIYLVAGFDYFRTEGAEVEDLHAEAGRHGDRVGNALLVLDTDDLDAGWRRLADLPGTARGMARPVACGERIYVIQGTYAGLQRPATGSRYRNAVDSWCYDTRLDTWSRIRDAPDGANRSAVGWRDRYALLIGEYKYPQNQYPDGTRTDVYTEWEKAQDWKHFFGHTVLVYDSRQNAYTETDPLLEQTSFPMVAVRGDTVCSLGGEGGQLWHPDAFQIGYLRET